MPFTSLLQNKFDIFTNKFTSKAQKFQNKVIASSSWRDMKLFLGKIFATQTKSMFLKIVLLQIIFKFYSFPLELVCLLKYAPEVIEITTQADYQELRYQRYFIVFNLT